MKTLVIVAHPSLETSVVNKRWVRELLSRTDKYTVHDLYKAYPDGKIDAEKEQALVESHGNLVFQFPIHWFHCPPLLQAWFDDVLTYGWAYGSKGDRIKNRKIALAVSAGIRKEDYSPEGRYRYTLEQILVPFETTFRYCQADYRSFFAFYGQEKAPGGNEEEQHAARMDELEQSARDYLHFIDSL